MRTCTETNGRVNYITLPEEYLLPRQDWVLVLAVLDNTVRVRTTLVIANLLLRSLSFIVPLKMIYSLCSKINNCFIIYVWYHYNNLRNLYLSVYFVGLYSVIVLLRKLIHYCSEIILLSLEMKITEIIFLRAEFNKLFRKVDNYYLKRLK